MNPQNKRTFIIVDGSSYLFRAYYALPPLTNSKGQATGAILGVINMLKKLMLNYAPAWMVVVFDSKEPTFRHELFPAYKINRTKMPEDLASQIYFLLEIIRGLGLSVIQIPGLEADDIIGSLIFKVRTNNVFSLVATGDKDLAQLVNDDVALINTMTDVVLDPPGVISKFNVSADQIVDYLVLTGDQVDNIPGVANVGSKTAVKWLKQYQDLKGIIKHSHEITGKVGDNLRKAIKDLPLYLKLVTIDTSLDLKLSLDDFMIKHKDHLKLHQLFTELEMYSWLKELEISEDQLVNTTLDALGNHRQEISLQPHLTKNLDQLLSQWVTIIAETDIFAFHLITNNTDPLYAEITGMYLATANDACYLKLDNFKELLGSVKLNRDQNVHKYSQASNLIKLLDFLQNRNKTKVTYNLKYVSQVLDNYGIRIEPIFCDVMLEAYVLNSSATINFDIHNIDAKKILELHNNLFPQILNTPKLDQILRDIEIPLTIVLKNMERTGVLIDTVKLSKQSKAMQKKINICQKTAYNLAGSKINLNSPKQLQDILYSKLGLPILEKTPKGQPSTSEAVLQELSATFELPKIILQYRTFSKLQSTYIEKLPKVINLKTGRIHTCYNQTGTVTGRLSSRDPNLQNIPIKTPEGRSIREAFIARAGYKILAADYSQIELRILAHLSEDPGLINAFQADLDIHTMTASEIFHVKLDSVTEELRRKAKAINFGLIYGMSDFGLAKQLKIARVEAETYIKTYFAKFPKVLDFMESTRQFAATHGYVETMFGRRLYLPEIKSHNAIRRKAAERAAINAPMQGGQADLIKLAMIKIDHWINTEAQDIFMLMQVHDELVFEVPDDLKSNKDKVVVKSSKIDMAKAKIIKIMQEVAQLKVELKVDVGVGDHWGEAH